VLLAIPGSIIEGLHKENVLVWADDVERSDKGDITVSDDAKFISLFDMITLALACAEVCPYIPIHVHVNTHVWASECARCSRQPNTNPLSSRL
jgi:hypothetical protein